MFANSFALVILLSFMHLEIAASNSNICSNMLKKITDIVLSPVQNGEMSKVLPSIMAQELWKENPVLLVITRRPG